MADRARLLRLTALIAAKIEEAGKAPGFQDHAAWRAHHDRAREIIRELEATEGARYRVAVADAASLAIDGVRSSATGGDWALLRNWRAAALKRIAAMPATSGSEAIVGETSRDRDAAWSALPRSQAIAGLRARNAAAEELLRPMLTVGDRLRATKAECGAREATFTFAGWDKSWIISKSGDSIPPGSVYSVNGDLIRVNYSFTWVDEWANRGRSQPGSSEAVADSLDDFVPF